MAHELQPLVLDAVPCVLHGIENQAYHTGPGLSHSGVKRIRTKTPYHFHALNQPHDAPPSAPSPQMMNGTLVHCALLEPAAFDARYVVATEGADKRSKAYREFVAANPDREVITSLQRDQAFAQADALRRVPRIAELMKTGGPERSVYWRDPATQVLCKCRPDWVSEGWGDGGQAVMLLDVKTTADASRDAFRKSIGNFGYHTQADWYCSGYAMATGREVLGMVFAVVESEYPHACAVYMLSDTALLKAREENREALNRFAECEAANDWPSYPSEIQVLDLMPWH
jgi:PDDEXK-like domain of unknown function (DUF3799)